MLELADHSQGLTEGLQGLEERTLVLARFGQGGESQAPAVLQPRPVERRVVGLDQLDGGVQGFDSGQGRGGVGPHVGQLEQGLGAELVRAGEQHRVVGAVQRLSQPGQVAQSLTDQGGVAEAGAGGDGKLGLIQAELRTGGFRQADAPVGDEGGEILDGDMEGQGITGPQSDPGLDQGFQRLHLGRGQGVLQQMIGGGVQARFGEEFGAHEAGPRLGADGCGLQLRTALLAGHSPGVLRGRGRLAQSRRVA